MATDSWAIRGQIKTLVDTANATSGVELFPGFLFKPSQLINQKVPSYYIKSVGFNTEDKSDTHNAYRHLFWEVRIFYDEITTTAGQQALSVAIDQIYSLLIQRTQTLNDEVFHILPNSLVSNGEETELIANEQYLVYSIVFSVETSDDARL